MSHVGDLGAGVAEGLFRFAVIGFKNVVGVDHGQRDGRIVEDTAQGVYALRQLTVRLTCSAAAQVVLLGVVPAHRVTIQKRRVYVSKKDPACGRGLSGYSFL